MWDFPAEELPSRSCPGKLTGRRIAVVAVTLTAFPSFAEPPASAYTPDGVCTQPESSFIEIEPPAKAHQHTHSHTQSQRAHVHMSTSWWAYMSNGIFAACFCSLGNCNCICVWPGQVPLSVDCRHHYQLARNHKKGGKLGRHKPSATHYLFLNLSHFTALLWPGMYTALSWMWGIGLPGQQSLRIRGLHLHGKHDLRSLQFGGQFVG